MKAALNILLLGTKATLHLKIEVCFCDTKGSRKILLLIHESVTQEKACTTNKEERTPKGVKHRLQNAMRIIV